MSDDKKPDNPPIVPEPGELDDIDPFPYLTLRLREFDVAAPPTVIAAAMLQYARQLAFGNTAGGDLDDVMADLDGLL